MSELFDDKRKELVISQFKSSTEWYMQYTSSTKNLEGFVESYLRALDNSGFHSEIEQFKNLSKTMSGIMENGRRKNNV